jgi:hypothetical protein
LGRLHPALGTGNSTTPQTKRQWRAHRNITALIALHSLVSGVTDELPARRFLPLTRQHTLKSTPMATNRGSPTGTCTTLTGSTVTYQSHAPPNAVPTPSPTPLGHEVATPGSTFQERLD